MALLDQVLEGELQEDMPNTLSFVEQVRALRAMRKRIETLAMAKAVVRPHGHMRIHAGKLTHTSQEAATALQHVLTRKFHAMRSKVMQRIYAAVNKALSAGPLTKMDVDSVEEFKQATAGKTRYSVNHIFDKPLQIRPGGKRPYGRRSEIYEKEINLADLTPTQHWLKPETVLDYAEQGRNPKNKQDEDKPVHVVAKDGDWLLSDGHHRAAAARLNGEKTVTALVFPRWASDVEIEAAKKRHVKFWVGGLAKQDDYDDLVKEIMESLQDDFTSLPPEVEQYLQTAALSGLTQGVIAIDVSDTGLLSTINTTAQNWAADRAAELVGMQYDAEGNLIDNPNPEWAITGTTRDKIREVVAEAFAEPSTMADIAAAIDQTGVFDTARAAMIARTEVSRAQIMGNLELWMQSGVVQQVDWLVSEEAPCDDCQELADGSPYDIEDAPVPIDDSHPNCMCILAARVADDSEK